MSLFKKKITYAENPKSEDRLISEYDAALKKAMPEIYDANPDVPIGTIIAKPQINGKYRVMMKNRHYSYNMKLVSHYFDILIDEEFPTLQDAKDRIFQ